MTLAQTLLDGARGALDLVFPPRCVGCKAYVDPGMLACKRCKHAVFDIAGPMCRICGQPRRRVAGGYAGVDEVCATCLSRRPRFDRARARWEYSGTISEAIQRAKYRAETWAIRALAAALHPWLVAMIDEFVVGAHPLVTGVPMHPSDLQRRGFNAALLLARLALPDHAIADRIAVKQRNTPAQAGLSRGQRLANVRSAFGCGRPALIEGRSVVVIDDVMTTGATANAVAAALGEAGARQVIVLTAARAIR